MSSTEGQVIKCKAAVAWEPNKPLEIEEIEVDPPAAHEVRIQIVSTGVCHTDATAKAGNDIYAVFPTILGHEGAGIVESVGEGVTKFKAGDHVIPLYIPRCFECVACESKKTNLCYKIRLTQARGLMPNGTSRFHCRGKQIFHYMGTSTFSEYTVVADISLCKINEKASLENVCLLGCCIPTGYGAALNTAKVQPGSVCAVFGLGAVGLAAVMGCKKAGASKIYAIDINPAKFEMAKKFGATDFVNPKDVEETGDSLKAHLVKCSGGFDYTFECIGNINTMRAAFESTKAGWGVATIIGLSAPSKELSILPLDCIVGRTLKGSAFGGCIGVSDIPRFVEEYMRNELVVDDFITHRKKLKNVNEAFDLMLSGKAIRTVLVYN